jgi:hypothetical protein
MEQASKRMFGSTLGSNRVPRESELPMSDDTSRPDSPQEVNISAEPFARPVHTGADRTAPSKESIVAGGPRLPVKLLGIGAVVAAAVSALVSALIAFAMTRGKDAEQTGGKDTEQRIADLEKGFAKINLPSVLSEQNSAKAVADTFVHAVIIDDGQTAFALISDGYRQRLSKIQTEGKQLTFQHGRCKGSPTITEAQMLDNKKQILVRGTIKMSFWMVNEVPENSSFRILMSKDGKTEQWLVDSFSSEVYKTN